MSDPPSTGLFDGVLARGSVRAQVGDRAWLEAMLDFEAALARAQARLGLVSSEDAQAIERACDPDAFDVPALGQAAAETGNPVVPLLAALRNAIGGRAADAVHRGATSQDVLDSAAMLIAKRALGPLLEDLFGASDSAAALTRRHAASVMVGRTLLQPALPTTFGLKAAGWLVGLEEAGARLDHVRRVRLAVQLGGAAGTLSALGERGQAVLEALAAELGLSVPVLPWHTQRTRVVELGSALAEAAGVLAKPARDVILLAQAEVGEVREGVRGRGGSSTLPHKHNPVAAISAAACAARAPGLAATLLACMAHEHERAAGAWHAEWRPFSDLLVAVGSAAAWLLECLSTLEVNEQRMHQNLHAAGALLAERVSLALAPALGRAAADRLLAEVSSAALAAGRPLGAELKSRPRVTELLTPSEIDDLLEPTGYLGSARLFIERALTLHAARASALAGGQP